MKRSLIVCTRGKEVVKFISSHNVITGCNPKGLEKFYMGKKVESVTGQYLRKGWKILELGTNK